MARKIRLIPLLPRRSRNAAGDTVLQKRERYVLMPARGVQVAPLDDSESRSVFTQLRQLHLRNVVEKYLGARPAARRTGVHIGFPSDTSDTTISDAGTTNDATINTGAKLVELTRDERLTLQKINPHLRVLPVVYYDLAHVARRRIASRAAAAAAIISPSISVTAVAADTGIPLSGAVVAAFTDFSARRGDEGRTDTSGTVSLTLASVPTTLDALLIYPPAGYWGYFARHVPLPTLSIQLLPIDLTTPDFLQEVYGVAPLGAGAEVKVGVIDTGIDSTHPHLQVTGGAVFCTDENDAGTFGPVPAEYGEHGTHVAGIIASRGQSPTGKRGLAPAVALMSYRVFPNAGGGAMNFDIVRAIESAVADGCDLVNISIQLGSPDAAVQSAIQVALEKGTVCLAAAGNNYRKPVSYPAQYPEALAISALGKQGTFPPNSSEAADVMAPFATTDPTIFLGAFSNIGPELFATAPGVGIVSTLPGGLYGVQSGTSMACPAVTGFLAARLATQTALLRSPRDAIRSSKIKALLTSGLRPVGLGPTLEGAGLVS